MLMGLTAVSFGIGVLGRGGVGFMALLVIIVILKGHLISDFFMGLRRANTLWRALILVYLVIIGGGIAAGYLIGMS
jgi:cytochrome c oxidase subunit IV